MHSAECCSNVLVLWCSFVGDMVLGVGTDAGGAESNHTGVWDRIDITFETEIGDNLMGMKITVEFGKIDHFRTIKIEILMSKSSIDN